MVPQFRRYADTIRHADRMTLDRWSDSNIHPPTLYLLGWGWVDVIIIEL